MAKAMAKEELTTGSTWREGSLPSVEVWPHHTHASPGGLLPGLCILFGGGEPWSVNPCFVWMRGRLGSFFDYY